MHVNVSFTYSTFAHARYTHVRTHTQTVSDITQCVWNTLDLDVITTKLLSVILCRWTCVAFPTHVHMYIFIFHCKYLLILYTYFHWLWISTQINSYCVHGRILYQKHLYTHRLANTQITVSRECCNDRWICFYFNQFIVAIHNQSIKYW